MTALPPAPPSETVPRSRHGRSLDGIQNTSRYKVRRAVAILAALGIGIGLTWIFCNGSVAYLLFLCGCALVQVAASKLPLSLKYNPAPPWDLTPLLGWDLPPLFMNPVVSFVVQGLALIAFVGEFAVGLARHSWWAALFLWVPPLVGASGIFDASQRNPSLPFFLGIAALIAAGMVIVG